MTKDIGTTGFSLHDDKFYGFYRATVKDNIDPLQLGRIKAEVIPYYVGLEVAQIPWAVPKNSLKSGSGIGTGSFNVPDIGSMVWVFFEMGDMYQPVYDGEAPDGIHGLPAFRTTSYPNRRGFTTSSGVVVWIDDITKQIKVIHPEGSYVSFNTEGFITFYAAGNIKLDSSVVKVTGNMDVDTGWSGTFSTADGKTTTVSTGIITNSE